MGSGGLSFGEGQLKSGGDFVRKQVWGECPRLRQFGVDRQRMVITTCISGVFDLICSEKGSWGPWRSWLK